MSKALKPIATILRDAIRSGGLTHYAVGKATGDDVTISTRTGMPVRIAAG